LIGSRGDIVFDRVHILAKDNGIESDQDHVNEVATDREMVTVESCVDSRQRMEGVEYASFAPVRG
jgi:hypothetical protein